jgi:hypothetical protein
MTDGQLAYLALVVLAFTVYAATLAVQAWRNPGWPRHGHAAPEIVDSDDA